jgi:S1-C subfamily serine protease
MAPPSFASDTCAAIWREEPKMAEEANDLLLQLSDALAARAATAQPLVAAIRARDRLLGGIFWRGDVVVAAEQAFPKTSEVEIALTGGRTIKALVAGRDPGTNIVALRLEQAVETTLPPAAEPRPGTLALALAAGEDGASVRFGVIRAVGAAWRSLAGGLIDRRIELDFAISWRDEGGPVIDVTGALLGMSTAGPRRRGLVIPGTTVDRVLEPLLTTGRVQRGWLGVALHPVALPEMPGTAAGQRRGLMVMRVAAEGPAASSGIQPGDILVRIGETPTTDPHGIGRLLGPDIIGQRVDVQLIRAGSPLTVPITITARPTSA